MIFDLLTVDNYFMVYFTVDLLVLYLYWRDYWDLLICLSLLLTMVAGFDSIEV